MATVGLSAWGQTSIKKYSKGMLQRLGLALAMLHDPELLILDEPTDGVDPVGRSEMRTLLLGLKAQGKTIFVNSHLLQEVELVCDRVAILDHGRMLQQGKISELTSAPKPKCDWSSPAAITQLRGARRGLAAAETRPLGTEQFEILLRGVDQPQIDRAIDQLRGRG